MLPLMLPRNHSALLAASPNIHILTAKAKNEWPCTLAATTASVAPAALSQQSTFSELLQQHCPHSQWWFYTATWANSVRVATMYFPVYLLGLMATIMALSSLEHHGMLSESNLGTNKNTMICLLQNKYKDNLFDSSSKHPSSTTGWDHSQCQRGPETGRGACVCQKVEHTGLLKVYNGTRGQRKSISYIDI